MQDVLITPMILNQFGRTEVLAREKKQTNQHGSQKQHFMSRYMGLKHTMNMRIVVRLGDIYLSQDNGLVFALENALYTKKPLFEFVTKTQKASTLDG